MFKFRLQRVLDLRAKREEEAATELAEAREAAERAQLEAEALRKARVQAAAAGGAPGARPVGQLQNTSYVLSQIDLQVDAAHQAAHAAEGVVRERFAAFATAFQERRVLDKLREKDHDSWRAAAVQLDRATMDAIALTRFAQPAVSVAEAEEPAQ
jgi:flagellar export protein FliJ